MSTHAPEVRKLQLPIAFPSATPSGVAPKGQSRGDSGVWFLDDLEATQHYERYTL